MNQIVCTPSKNSSASSQCRLLAYLSHIASLGTFWETRRSTDLHQLRRRICHAMLSSEQTGLGLIKDTLLHVIGARRGTLPSSKASGARRGRKKGTVKSTLLPTGDGEGTQSGWEREEAGRWLKSRVRSPSTFLLLCLVHCGQGLGFSICIRPVCSFTRP